MKSSYCHTCSNNIYVVRTNVYENQLPLQIPTYYFFFFRLTIICCGHGVNIPVNIFPFSDSVTASCGGQEIRGEKRIEVLAGFQFRF